jgi:murein DD-endopeptidase
MQEMPLLGRPRRRSRRGLAVVALIVVAAGAIIAWRLIASRGEPAQPEAAAAPAAAPVATPASTPDAAPPPPLDPLQAAGLRYVKATIEGPLETALVAQVGRELGEPLSGVVTRNLVWWVRVPEDLRKGDTVEVLFSERQGAEPLVHAVRFTSSKSARTFEAYRFQAPGAAYPRYFTRDAQELELRLSHAPLDDHEQVTSLIRDGRGHRGVDFRVPVGTPVKATFDAVVTRKNWGFRVNGNCVELREQGGAGRTALFLHLSEVLPEIRPGGKVTRGQVIARSGNTGRSFAPHLHYQLEAPGGKVLDPFEAEGTMRKALPEEHKPAFLVEVARLEGLMSQGATAKR